LDDCLFCKIVSGRIKSETVYSDDQVVAFRDVAPQAPVHVLIVPRKHIATLNDLAGEDTLLAGHVMLVAGKIARDLKVAGSGYRIVANCNKDAGQAVMHVHFHLLGGRALDWPPG
jgi:histidine triad (HIT) family protein